MRLKKLLSIILSPLVLGSYSANAVKQSPDKIGEFRTLGKNVQGLSYAKRNRKKNKRRNNMKVLEDAPGNGSALKCVGYLSAAILSPFLLYGGYELFKKCFLDDVPKEKINEISDEIKNYHTKKELSPADVEYGNWLKKLPEKVVREVIGEMPIDAWNYFLDNFENEIDLEIYVGMHDKSVDEDHKGIGVALCYTMNDGGVTQQGILEHEMKLKMGLPFERDEGMTSGIIKKVHMDSMLRNSFHRTFATTKIKDIENLKFNVFCPWQKLGEGRNAEELSRYVAATFNEYKKELGKIKSSDKKQFDIGMDLKKNEVNNFLENLQKNLDENALRLMFGELSDEALEEIYGKETGGLLVKFCEGRADLSKCGGLSKLKELLSRVNEIVERDLKKNGFSKETNKDLKEKKTIFKDGYKYLFDGDTRPEKWNINTVTWKGTKDDKIIELIVRVCQALIQTHTFRDGNTRVNTCWLLNKLLVDSGFLPVAFGHKEDDEKCSPAKMFYGGDIKELIKVVKDGQDNFVSICNRSGIKIPSVLKRLG